MGIETTIKNIVHEAIEGALRPVLDRLAVLANKKEWFSMEEAADYLSVSKTTLYNAYTQGQLKGYRKGPKTIRFFKCDLDGYDYEG